MGERALVRVSETVAAKVWAPRREERTSLSFVGGSPSATAVNRGRVDGSVFPDYCSTFSEAAAPRSVLKMKENGTASTAIGLQSVAF